MASTFRKKSNFEDISMHQSLLFSESLQDLKNLRSQLYSAAEYFEQSYTNDDHKHLVVNTLREYVINAMVNTVDHLGSVSYKVNDLLSENVEQLSNTKLKVACIEQRLKTCGEYNDHEGVSQQSLSINAPKFQKRYVFPVGLTMHGGNYTQVNNFDCRLDNKDDWHHLKSAVKATPTSVNREQVPQLQDHLYNSFTFTAMTPRKEPEPDNKRTVSPHRFPLLRSGSLSSPGAMPNSRRAVTPSKRQHLGEQRKSSSMHVHSEKETAEQYPIKNRRFLKSLLTHRRKAKKDDILYAYLNEY